MKKRIRLLPLVIFVAALTLTVKIGAIWNDVNVIGPGPAQAAGKKDIASDPAKPAPAKSGAAKRAVQVAANTPNNSGDKRKPGSFTFDPTKATDAELEVLEKLAARRNELEQRASDLDIRENLLKATEVRIDGKITELKQIKQTIDGLLKQHDAEREAKMKSLVKIYESMKPKDAARIFEKLEIDVLMDVVERMREARAAPILAKMSAARAKQVTAALAARRALPKLAELSDKSRLK